MLVTADVVGLYPSIPCSSASSVLSNYFEFSEKKFPPPYACINMDEEEIEFLQTDRFKPLVWLRYIDYIFFIWTHGKENLNSFMKEFNNFKSNLKFNFECDTNSINFPDFNVKLNNNELTTSVYIPTDRDHYLHYRSSHPDHIKRSNL